MPIEPAISEDFEPYDDERELRRLTRAVQFSKKHYLYFACCNQVPKQNDLIADVKKSLKDKPIKVVRFKKPITDLLGELQKRIIGKDCEAVFVQGLEYSIASDDRGEQNRLIYNLNISRDAFKKYLPCPLFLWLPEYALVKITRHAPDFFSVRSGTFYFSNPPELVTKQIFQSVTSNWTEINSLSLAEKRKQIETLENLLAEYRGLHREKQDEKAEMWLLSRLGDFFYSISRYQKAIEYHKHALQLSLNISDRNSEANFLDNLGLDYFNLGNYQEAIDYHNQALQISRNIGDRVGEANSLSNLGISYSILGQSRKAIDYHKKSLQISRNIGDQNGKNISSGNLGIAYKNLGEYQKAVKYLEESLAIALETGDRLGQSNSLSNLGGAYIALGEYQKAIEYHNQSLNISRDTGNRQGEGINLTNLAIVYASLGERERACGIWKEAVIIFEAIESPYADNVRQMLKKYCQS